MLSRFAAELDAPQTLPATRPSFHQTGGWYERQVPTSLLPGIVFGSDVPRLSGNVFPQAYPYEQTRPNRNSAAQLRTLQRHYTILDGNHLIIQLLEEESALFTLLIEAVRPLQIAFGARRLFQVRVQHSDDDSLLRVAVQLPAGFGGDPEQALRLFDEDWWLDNCHRSGGALVFDYEIQDAV
jgi:hypothetical protein